MLNLVSLAPGNNQLHREAKKRPLFYFCSLVYIANTFLRILADLKGAHLWISSMDVSTLMFFRFSFNLSGIVPNAPTTMVIILSLRPTSFGFLLRDLDIFTLPRPLLLPSSGISTSIIWQLPASILWSLYILSITASCNPYFQYTFRNMVIPPLISLNPYFYDSSQWIPLATLSCLLLYSFCASFGHVLTIWQIIIIIMSIPCRLRQDVQPGL